MDGMVYLAMSGARQVMHRQAINSHNLANVDTTGFRRALDGFEAMPMYGPGHPGRVQVQDRSQGADFSQGAIRTTGDPLNVALQGPGFIAVQDVDGNEAWTRNGDLSIGPDGLLQTSSGQPVLGNAGPITLTAFEELDIAEDGTITVRPLGEGAAGLAIIDRIKLVNPDPATIERNERGLFTGDQEAVADAAVTVQSGALETSNVNTVDSLVTMIELARQFETQVKLMKTAEDTDSAATRLLASS